MSVFEVVNRFPKTMDIFRKHGLHCFGCFAAQYENVEQAAQAHGLDAKKLLKDLNRAL
jgi:hybrid cluster-associated redox disulfide protein